MKTIKQIAEEIGVSKQAVQKRISREPLCTSIQPYIDKKGNTKYISTVGENLIKSVFEEKADIDTSISVAIDDNKNYDNRCASLYIDTLVKQLDIKDKQIEKLQDENEKLITSLENMTQSLKGAQALHAGTMQKEFLTENINCVQEDQTINEMEDSQQEPIITASAKKSLFKKIFGR